MLVGHNEDGVDIDTSVVKGSAMWEIVVASMLDDFSVAMLHVALREVLFNSKKNYNLK